MAGLANDPDVIPNTYCPFGVGAVVVPQQTVLGQMQMGVAQHAPNCTKRCMFYSRINDAGCKILLACNMLMENASK